MNKQERTYATLRERVLNGSYRPGHRLIIDALARELDVSALPVREAIRRLEAEGWVTYRRNHGAEVVSVDDSWWESGMTTLAVLEGYATRLAAPELSMEDLDRLRDINAQMQGAIDDFDVDRFSRLNRDFHKVLYDNCPNAHTVELMRQTRDRLDMVRETMFKYIPYRGKASVSEHAQIIDLLASRDGGDKLEMATRQHKLNTVLAFKEHHEGHTV